MVHLDPRYWSNYFKQVFCKQVTIFTDSIANRMLPTFDQIESEAEAVAEQEWERLGSVFYEDSDMGDFAEQARDAGIEYYHSLEAVRQSLINITATALHHMFEQQVFLFHRKQVLNPEEEDDIKLINMKEFKKRLAGFGISIETLSAWSKIEELGFVANAIKHAEGPSADKLHSLRPDLFVHPFIRENPVFNFSVDKPSVYLPLIGEDIYLSADDLNAYAEALTSFWEEFAEAIQVKQ